MSSRFLLSAILLLSLTVQSQAFFGRFKDKAEPKPDQIQSEDVEQDVNEDHNSESRNNHGPVVGSSQVDYSRNDLDQKPTSLDTMFRGKENELSTINPDKRNGKGEFAYLVGKESTSKEIYVLQFEALADFDAAQKRRSQLSSRTGFGIYLVFNAPFYKLRSGRFSSKVAAEDAIAKLAAANVSAFLVKIE